MLRVAEAIHARNVHRLCEDSFIEEAIAEKTNTYHLLATLINMCTSDQREIIKKAILKVKERDNLKACAVMTCIDMPWASKEDYVELPTFQ